MQADRAGVSGRGSGPPRSLAERAIAAAVEFGLISLAQVESGSVQVQSLNQSSRVARLAGGDQAWIVKNAGGGSRPGNDWRAELAVYSAVTPVPDTTIAPTLVGYSQDHEVILIEALDQKWRRLDSFELRSPWSIEIVSRVATGLARWHQASQSLNDIGQAEVALFSAFDTFVDSILDDQSLQESVRVVQGVWGASHVMHGDVRLTHVMCHDDGQVRLIDWTASGWGDPRWDLAGLLQELHSAEIENGINTAAHRLAVLSSYAERAPSPSTLAETDPTLQAFVACRLIWRALQIHQSPTETSERVATYLAAARDLRPS